MSAKAFLYKAILLSLLAGCEVPDLPSEDINASDLYGRYTGNFGETDINYFDLYPDSTYVSYYKNKENVMFVDSGTWKYQDNFDGTYNLDLFDYHRRYPELCLDYPDRDELRRQFGVDTTSISLGLSKRRGRIEVRYCFGKGQYYLKDEE